MNYIFCIICWMKNWFKNEIFWTKVLRMTGEGLIISVREIVILVVILSKSKNLKLIEFVAQ